MFNVKTEGNAVKILDPKTGGVKCRIPVMGEISGAAQIQGDMVFVQIKDGNNTRVKIYDARTGNLKGNYA